MRGWSWHHWLTLRKRRIDRMLRGTTRRRRMGQRLRRCQNLVKWGNVPSVIRKAPRGRHGRDLGSLTTPGVDPSQSQSRRRNKVNGLAAPNVASGRRRWRCHHETSRASPIPEDVAERGGVAKRGGVTKGKRSQSRRYYPCETFKGVVNTSINSFTSPIPTGRKDCGGR